MILILYALVLVLVLAFTGLVVDLGIVYLRRAQLQAAADNMAISAALKLNGTAGGLAAAVADAVARAATIPEVTADDVGTDILRFSANPYAGAGDWLPQGSIDAAAAANMMYVRIDIGALSAAVREWQPLLMGIFGGMAPFDVRPVAVAGRRSLNVTPFAICARSTEPSGTRTSATAKTTIHERISYGFRHGVAYNLLRLNPHGTDPVFYYVDPLTPPDVDTATSKTTATVMAPFMCSGTLAYPRIGAGRLWIARQATFGLAAQLNSRFNEYGGAGNAALDCTRESAPPDINIRNYAQAGAIWHHETPVNTSAASMVIGNELATIADLPHATLTALKPAPTEYGVRWSFRSPRTTGNVRIASAWDVLYPSTSAHVAPKSWPTDAPYFASRPATTYDTEPIPAKPAFDGRRLMHIPLLQCEAAAGPNITRATVLAYGMFFLTAPASSNEIPGEFAGFVSVASEGTLLGAVELVR
ncbi:pilus assembly protein TadG-related protein [Pseudoduganella umbonata]|uniref:Putative Flp pilus-assembly TadG-like N-terminal domain-containing protein n=1 Tax=Pseudoduganella umbonata TaxID=864828 RepID=A0A7W5HEH0_9BURK|nr:pilus assembly protein TadG-related protein [Pseudoduganella umbonata]MBB3223779.1 hypothetical protein [Pseudoduganella umbonata]